MAEDTNEEGKKSPLVLYIAIGVGGVVLLAVGLIVGYLLFGQAPDPSEQVTEIIEQQEAEEAAEAGEGGEGEGEPEGPKKKEVLEPATFDTTYWPFPAPVTVNLTNSRKIVQIEMSISTQYDAKVIENIEMHIPALQSTAIAVIAEFQEGQVKTREGKRELRDAIRDALNEELLELSNFGGIEHVHFTSE
jgi:flagellar FliL protein